MLVLSRKENESIVIDGDITITILEIRGNKVRLGIECPLEVSVMRQEICDRQDVYPDGLPLLLPATNNDGERVQFVEMSLGQLLAQVGARQSDIEPESGFTNEGGILPAE
jgi:carbon storage regulator